MTEQIPLLIAGITSGFLGAWLFSGFCRFFYRTPTHEDLQSVQRDLREEKRLGAERNASLEELQERVDGFQELQERLKSLEDQLKALDVATTRTLAGLCNRMDSIERPRFGDKVLAKLNCDIVLQAIMLCETGDGRYRVLAKHEDSSAVQEFTVSHIEPLERR